MKKRITLFRFIAGSHASGLNTENSDLDIIEVYLQFPEERWCEHDQKIVQEIKDGVDIKYIEFSNFVNKCVAGNIEFVQCLFGNGENLESFNYDLFFNKASVDYFLSKIRSLLIRKNVLNSLRYTALAFLAKYENEGNEKYLKEFLRYGFMLQDYLSADVFSLKYPVDKALDESDCFNIEPLKTYLLFLDFAQSAPSQSAPSQAGALQSAPSQAGALQSAPSQAGALQSAPSLIVYMYRCAFEFLCNT